MDLILLYQYLSVRIKLDTKCLSRLRLIFISIGIKHDTILWNKLSPWLFNLAILEKLILHACSGPPGRRTSRSAPCHTNECRCVSEHEWCDLRSILFMNDVLLLLFSSSYLIIVRGIINRTSPSVIIIIDRSRRS